MTSQERFAKTGEIYAPNGDKCVECNKIITPGVEEYVWLMGHNWDGKGEFNHDLHSTGELKGYKHMKCLK